jgi:hypothetical protein
LQRPRRGGVDWRARIKGGGVASLDELGASAKVILVVDSSVSESYWRLHSWPCDLIGHPVVPWPKTRIATDCLGGNSSKVSVRRTTGGESSCRNYTYRLELDKRSQGADVRFPAIRIFAVDFKGFFRWVTFHDQFQRYFPGQGGRSHVLKS